MDATPEQAAEGMALVRVLAAVLERLVCANAGLARADPGQITKFHALKAPGIGVLQYLERIHKYASCSNECFILALIYIDRLIQRNNFLLTELNVHRVVITSILLAAKFFDDAYYNNAYYAKVGGVLVSEMNGLEVDFLFRINFSLHVTPELFHKYHAELLSHSVGAGVTSTPELPNPSIVSATTSPHIAPSHAVQPVESKAQILLHTDYAQHPLQSCARQSMQITPSPPPPSAHPVAPPIQVGADGIIAGQAACTLNSTQPQGTAFTCATDAAVIGDDPQHQFAMLQRQNTMPMVTKGIASAIMSSNRTPPFTVSQQTCSPRPPYSAPSMIPVGMSPPGLVPASQVKATDQYLVVDNMAYPIHGGLVHYQHSNPNQMDVSIVPNVQAHRATGAAQQAQFGSQHIVNGRMLAGCTGGL